MGRNKQHVNSTQRRTDRRLLRRTNVDQTEDHQRKAETKRILSGPILFRAGMSEFYSYRRSMIGGIKMEEALHQSPARRATCFRRSIPLSPFPSNCQLFLCVPPPPRAQINDQFVKPQPFRPPSPTWRIDSKER
ncbi:hypothetical protein niasHT_003190 [Heterodera trifolii]|uniref:Uncharacterized protein n=1 Tax=Heterodera trifolii TaxID=157864 RepID=A0ABD2LNI8_9BILA